jgi:hypothetical protein
MAWFSKASSKVAAALICTSGAFGVLRLASPWLALGRLRPARWTDILAWG